MKVLIGVSEFEKGFGGGDLIIFKLFIVLD